jgi:hypothetical protein
MVGGGWLVVDGGWTIGMDGLGGWRWWWWKEWRIEDGARMEVEERRKSLTLCQSLSVARCSSLGHPYHCWER